MADGWVSLPVGDRLRRRDFRYHVSSIISGVNTIPNETV